MNLRPLLRWLGTAMIVGGAGMLVWVVLVWRWQDPFTALYTYRQQRELKREYSDKVTRFTLPVLQTESPEQYELVIADAARRYRRSLHEGDPIGRIAVPRLGLNMVLVNGTETDTLKKGPARETSTFLPGEGKLVYIAGHRTTYSAPFAEIDDLRAGDRVTIEVPYATFEYRIRGHRIVDATELAVLRSRGREEIALQACHPRFFASQRYIAYARPVRVIPRGGSAYAYRGTELSATASVALS
ncbi:MAG: class D sortase [Gaiellaceae bacterium]